MAKVKRLLQDKASRELLRNAYLNYRKKIVARAKQDPSVHDIQKAVHYLMENHSNEFLSKAIANIEKEEGKPMSREEREECRIIIKDFLTEIESDLQ